MNSIITTIRFDVDIICVWCGYSYLPVAKEQMQKSFSFSIDNHQCDPADKPELTEV